MSTFEKFEDIQAWQNARELANSVYRTTRDAPLNKDFALRDQLQRSAVSVMSDIAEGFGRRTNKDFANFLYRSKGSAMETISHLYIALDQDYINKDKFDSLCNGYKEVIKMLIGLIRYLESNPKPN